MLYVDSPHWNYRATQFCFFVRCTLQFAVCLCGFWWCIAESNSLWRCHSKNFFSCLCALYCVTCVMVLNAMALLFHALIRMYKRTHACAHIHTSGNPEWVEWCLWGLVDTPLSPHWFRGKPCQPSSILNTYTAVRAGGGPPGCLHTSAHFTQPPQSWIPGTMGSPESNSRCLSAGRAVAW